MVHPQLHDPLVPGMLPMLTRVLALGGDTTRLHRLVTNLRLLGYQVTSSTDPAAAMAGQGGQGFSFHVVMVDTSSHYDDCRAALELFEFAVREPQLCAYAIKEEGTYGPLEMEDINRFGKPNYNAESNGPKSPQVTPNGSHNTSASMAASAITNTLSSERRAKGNNRKHIRADSEEVEKDGEHVEMEQQQPADKPRNARVVWTEELHNKFVEAYNKLISRGEDPVPKKILALMGDSTLTRENIASHLQKYKFNLHSEEWTEPLRTRHSRMKQHDSTPQESFPSGNMSQQQAPPTVMRSQSATVFANNVVIHVQTCNTMDKIDMSALVDVPRKDMYTGADDPKQNSASCVGTSYVDNSFQEDTISGILSKEPEPTWDAEFLHSNRD